MKKTNDQPKRDVTEAMEIFDRLTAEKQELVLAYLRRITCNAVKEEV